MVFLSLSVLTGLAGCDGDSKGDGDVDPAEACSYVEGPTLAEVAEGEWPEGMTEAWGAFERIGAQEPMVLSCDDSTELEFAVTGVDLGAAEEFRFSEFTGPEGCEGLGPASGPMVLDIDVDGAAHVLTVDVRLNRHEGGSPYPVEAGGDGPEAEQHWQFSFDETGTLVDVFTAWPGVRSCSE